MDFEKVFINNYKKICMDITEERINSRIDGIETILEQFDEYDKINEIVKLYFNLDCNSETREEFINCFYEKDKTFDEQNAEEITILAGCTLLNMIDTYNDVQLAYSIKILEPFYEGKVMELSETANRIIDMQTRMERQMEQCPTLSWKEDWESELVDEDGKMLETAPKTSVELLNIIKNQFDKVISYVNSLNDKNKLCEEKVEVLSWVVGEWSDLLKRPLSEINDVEGAMVLGVELAALVDIPGPYAASSLLNKMLTKCKKETTEISLTEFIDSQPEEIRKYVEKTYCKEAEIRNLPILSAVKASLTVDEKKAWVPAYKKKWKIDSDNEIHELRKWAELIYFECMISKC